MTRTNTEFGRLPTRRERKPVEEIPASTQLKTALGVLRAAQAGQAERVETIEINRSIEEEVLPRIERRLDEPNTSGDPEFRSDIEKAIAYFKSKRHLTKTSEAERGVLFYLQQVFNSFESEQDTAA